MSAHPFLLTMLLCSTFLFACTDQREDKADNVFQGQIDALDKARSVEDTLHQGKQRYDQAIERKSE